MKLILQAIESLFRKVENSIPKSLADLLHGEKIKGDMVEDMYYQEPHVKHGFLDEQTFAFADQSSVWPYRKTTTHSHTIADFVYAKCPWIADADKTSETIDNKTVFIVKWDGVEYECVCDDIAEFFTLGNPALYASGWGTTDHPFCIMANSYYDAEGLYIIANDQAESHTVEIYQIEYGKIHPMPEKYIPEHQHSGTDIIGDELPLDVIPSLTDDKLPVVPITKGGTGASTIKGAKGALGIATGYGNNIAPSGKITDDLYVSTEEPVATTGGFIILVDITEHCTVARGYPNTAFINGIGIGMLENKFGSWEFELPEGQYLLVSLRTGSVENKPFATTSTILPLSDLFANGDKRIILASSTADSTKKFKLTVDDSGTITATEVT